jgi:hypothetical protein
MFYVSIRFVYCLFTKFFNSTDMEYVLGWVRNEEARRVVFIDTPPTPVLLETIRQLWARGVEVFVRDHHDCPDPKSPRDQEIHDAANQIRDLLGERAVISNRIDHPGCSSLIKSSEFLSPGTIIVADNDLDGLLGCCKAVGLTWPEIDQDAAVLDGARSEQTAENLSRMSHLLVRALATLPAYDAKKPHVSADAKRELFLHFMQTINGEQESVDWIVNKVIEHEPMVKAAEELAKTAIEVVPGVWSVRNAEPERVDLATLARLMEERQGCKVTVIFKCEGPIAKVHGTQASIAVVKRFQQEINLQNLIVPGFVSSPESGIICNTSFLLHVSVTKWFEQILPAMKVRFGEMPSRFSADFSPKASQLSA